MDVIFVRQQPVHPRDRLKKADTYVAFVRQQPIHLTDRLKKADADVVFVKKYLYI